MKIAQYYFKSIIKSAVITLILISILSAMSYHCAMRMPVVVGNPIIIEINKGDSFNQIIDKLSNANIAIQPLWFKFLAVEKWAFNKLKAGEYELTTGLTMPEILMLFVLGKTKQYAITFPEGWNFKQIQQAIINHPKIEHAVYETDLTNLMTTLGANDLYPEGMFFPDTYFFEKNTTDITLLKRAYQKMQWVLTQEWQKRDDDLPFKTPYEALILASIVEKETAVVSERPMIAGVFIRRIKKNMRLQTDPTVIYGMGDHYQGNIRRQDLMTVTPYNTYKIKGLPPTPIAMPGQAAINAVLHPDHSDNIYFVAKGDGNHYFSATLKEHNQAVLTFQNKNHETR